MFVTHRHQISTFCYTLWSSIFLNPIIHAFGVNSVLCICRNSLIFHFRLNIVAVDKRFDRCFNILYRIQDTLCSFLRTKSMRFLTLLVQSNFFIIATYNLFENWRVLDQHVLTFNDNVVHCWQNYEFNIFYNFFGDVKII